jgi:type I restriction enzyme M protein
MPANLFFGTGIPACIIVIDKENAHNRKGIFMIDASAYFMKDGPKNRLRERDIHQIVDAFTRQLEIPKYSRMVTFDEIEKNDFNLNIPRYIDSQQPEEIQDIEGHLRGGIPETDIDALSAYWSVCPQLRQALFTANRPGYLDLAIPKPAIKSTIYEHPEFVAFIENMNLLFKDWQTQAVTTLKNLQEGCHPKSVVSELAESLLLHYTDKPLFDNYAAYQHLMDYWDETMQDDCYLIAADGWTAEPGRVLVKNNKNKEVDKGWVCDLVPKSLVVVRYFAEELEAISQLEIQLETLLAAIAELEEEHGGEDGGVFSELEKVNKASVTARLKEIKNDKETKEESAILKVWLKLSNDEGDLKKAIKETETELDALAYAKYDELTEDEIKTIVVEDKWLANIAAAIHGEMDRISQNLARRVKELAERYETTLPEAICKVDELEKKVNAHLQKMGFSWN